jgi:inner membrane protein
MLERYFGHRSFTHSLLLQVRGGLLAWWLLPGGFALALITGWVGHAWADMMTKGGVAWFWPARIRCVLPGNPDFRMDVGKGGELAFLLVVALLGVVMMPLAATGKGTAGLIRGAIGDLETVRRHYDRDKGDVRFSVVVKGRDNIDHTDISGTYPIIGPWRETGLILDTEAGPRSLCAGSACNWYSSHAELAKGEAIRTSTLAVNTALIPVATLLARAEALGAIGDVRLLGTAHAEGVKPQPPTLEVAGDALTFVYAAPALLEGLRGRVCAMPIWSCRSATPPARRCPRRRRSPRPVRPCRRSSSAGCAESGPRLRGGTPPCFASPGIASCRVISASPCSGSWPVSGWPRPGWWAMRCDCRRRRKPPAWSRASTTATRCARPAPGTAVKIRLTASTPRAGAAPLGSGEPRSSAPDHAARGGSRRARSRIGTGGSSGRSALRRARRASIWRWSRRDGRRCIRGTARIRRSMRRSGGRGRPGAGFGRRTGRSSGLGRCGGEGLGLVWLRKNFGLKRTVWHSAIGADIAEKVDCQLARV